MAAGLLTAVLVLLVGVFAGGLQLMQRSEVHTAATTIGRSVLEDLEDRGGFTAVPHGPVVFDGSNPDPKSGNFPPDPYPVAVQDGREYTVTVEVRSPSSRLRSVLVSVSWGSGKIRLEKVFHASNSVL